MDMVGMALEAALWARDILVSPESLGIFGLEDNSTMTAITNELNFEATHSIRTSTIILTCFNIVAAFATSVGILWDSCLRAKQKDPNFKFRLASEIFSFFSFRC